MQVTSLFAIFFAFLTLVAPLATLAMQIAVPTNITTGNATIACTNDPTDPGGLLTFFLALNGTRKDTLRENITAAGALTVTIPANATGNGWTIQATSSDGTRVGISPVFEILAPSQTVSKKSMAIPIIGGVVAAVIIVSLLVLALFFYMRRRRQLIAGPEFDLEASFPPRDQSHQMSRSFSSTSAGIVFADTGLKSSSKSMEMEKVEWETRLEEQFARARAATPDISRGATPAPRASPVPLVPLMPKRGPARNPSY